MFSSSSPKMDLKKKSDFLNKGEHSFWVSQILHLNKNVADTTLFELQKCYRPFWKDEINPVILYFLQVPSKSTPSTPETDLKNVSVFFTYKGEIPCECHEFYISLKILRMPHCLSYRNCSTQAQPSQVKRGWDGTNLGWLFICSFVHSFIQVFVTLFPS